MFTPQLNFTALLQHKNKRTFLVVGHLWRRKLEIFHFPLKIVSAKTLLLRCHLNCVSAYLRNFDTDFIFHVVRLLPAQLHTRVQLRNGHCKVSSAALELSTFCERRGHFWNDPFWSFAVGIHGTLLFAQPFHLHWEYGNLLFVFTMFRRDDASKRLVYSRCQWY